MAIVCAQRDTLQAQLHALAAVLRAVLGTIDPAGFATPNEQSIRRAAEAMLAEVGR